MLTSMREHLLRKAERYEKRAADLKTIADSHYLVKSFASSNLLYTEAAQARQEAAKLRTKATTFSESSQVIGATQHDQTSQEPSIASAGT